MKPVRSLRLRLIVAGCAGVAVVALAAAWLLGAALERAALRALDRRLGEDLDGLIGQVEASATGALALRREPTNEPYERVFSGWYWQVEGAVDRLQSRSLWDTRIDIAPGLERRYGHATGPRGQRLRTVAQDVRLPDAAGPVRFAVAAELSEVDAEVRDFRQFTALAVALLSAGLLLVLVWQVDYGLRPLARLGATLRRVQRGEQARFDATTLPTEVIPLAQQINDLLDEHARRVQRARHTAQDLAHALKTPLAVLAAEGQRPGLQLPRVVEEQVRRMRAVVDKRLNGGVEADTRERTPVGEVVAALCQYMRVAYGARALDITHDVAAGLQFAGAREDLEELLGNLLDNACKWAHGTVAVRVSREGNRLHLIVEDDGPGMDAQARARAVRRGVRLDEQVPGTGLGLAIVSDIVASHGGAFTLEANANHQSRITNHGLRATLVLPCAH